ncbi:MAG TPA: hypothetical protein DCY12_05495 [Candidatus Atribacteria bacterium]|jgi:hypothetical protein|nr:hypothetical protein [Candidatus Atribacteria bacterium]
MFEEYLQDAHYFAVLASQTKNEKEAKRYYRVSIFCIMSAVEAFINLVADTFDQAGNIPPYENAFLTDRKFEIIRGSFQIVDKPEYHRTEEKLRFLIFKFKPDFDFVREPCWCRLIEFKKFRDQITHPRHEDNDIDIDEYKKITKWGLESAIEIMNNLCNGIFRKPLRRKLRELKLE